MGPKKHTKRGTARKSTATATNGGPTATTKTTTATGLRLLDLPDHIIVESILPKLIPSLLSGLKSQTCQLRGVLSAASTCRKLHELASHPSLWREVDGWIFYRRFVAAIKRGIAPPPLPLGAAHCGTLRVGFGSPADATTVAFMELFRDVTNLQIMAIRIDGINVRDRIIGAVSSLPRLTQLAVQSDQVMEAFGKVRLVSTHTFEKLWLSGNSVDVVGFLSVNSFPSVTSICLVFKDVDVGGVAGAIARSCPTLDTAMLTGSFCAEDVVTLAEGCKSLRTLTMFPKGNLTTDDVIPPVSAPQMRELSILPDKGLVVDSEILTLFPNLVRLNLGGVFSDSSLNLPLIGGMTDLELLGLDGSGFVGESCRRLLPLVFHPMTKGRRSLKTLKLSNFDSDLVDFLSSPWCSCLEDLTLRDCALSDSVLERFVAADSIAFKATLRTLSVQDTDCDGDISRLVASLPSLTSLDVGHSDANFDVNGIIRGLGRSQAKLAHLHIDAPFEGAAIDVGPLLPCVIEATKITLHGNFSPSAIESIDESCHCLGKFSFDTPYLKSKQECCVQ